MPKAFMNNTEYPVSFLSWHLRQWQARDYIVDFLDLVSLKIAKQIFSIVVDQPEVSIFARNCCKKVAVYLKGEHPAAIINMPQ